MLVDEGRLSLDDPVRRYLPAFPDDSRTVHHLLSQTSGFDVTDEIVYPYLPPVSSRYARGSTP